MAPSLLLYVLTISTTLVLGSDLVEPVDDVQPPTNLEHSKCRMTSAYPPEDKNKLKEYVINMNLSPEMRWKEPVTDFKDEINEFMDMITGSKIVKEILSVLEKNIDFYLDLFPKDWGKEIQEFLLCW